MEKFEIGSTGELKPHANYFSKDTISDCDTVALSQTKVIWAMSQNVLEKDNTVQTKVEFKPFYPLLLSLIACMAAKNPAGAIQTMSQYAKEKLYDIQSRIPNETYNSIVSTSFPSVGFPPSSVMYIHTVKSATPDRLPPQS